MQNELHDYIINKKKEKMKLNIQERLTLVNLVPERGNFETMTTVEKLKKVLYLSEEEVKEFEVQVIENKSKWNDKGSERKEIEISELGMSLLKKTLKSIDEAEQLSTPQYQIFKRIKEEQKE